MSLLSDWFEQETFAKISSCGVRHWEIRSRRVAGGRNDKVGGLDLIRISWTVQSHFWSKM